MKFGRFLKSWLTKRNKTIIVGLVFIALISIFIPPHFALAFNWNSLNPVNWGSSMMKAVFNGLIRMTFTVLAVVGTAFLELSQIIFQWVTSSSFISISFTGPDNVIVHEGWTMMRNLADVIILLGVVFIGLATAFNATGYDTKKMLLRLLVVALLINFTPVFCGAIIDGAGFFTRYFLNQSTTIAQGWGQNISTQFGMMKGSLLDNPGGTFAKALVILAFDLVSTFVFFMYAILFAVRYAVLWLLIIISPLAFLAWAFNQIPAAKNIFNRWWSNFLNWSIIGIPAAFVIYLSDKMLSIANQNKLVGTSTALQDFSPGIADDIMKYSVPLIFLIVGFLVTLSTSAEGSSLVINGVKSLGKKAGTKIGSASWKGTKALGRSAMTSTAARTAGAAAGAQQAWKQSRGARKPFSAIAGGLTGGFKKETIVAGKRGAEAWATKPGKFGYAQRVIGRTVLKAGLKAEQKDYEEKQKKAEKFDMMTNASRYQNVSGAGRLAIVANEIKQGRFGKFVKAAKITPEEALKLHSSAINLRDEGTQKAIERAFAKDLAEEFGTNAQKLGQYTVEQQQKDRETKGYTSYADKIVAESKDTDAIKQLSNSIGSQGKYAKEITEAIHKNWNGNQFEKAIENLGSKFTQTVRANDHPADWYLQTDQNTGRARNADLAFYRTNTAAQKSGVGFMEDVSVKDLKNQLKKDRIILPSGVERISPRIESKGKEGGFVKPPQPPKKTKRAKSHGPKKHWWNDYKKT